MPRPPNIDAFADMRFITNYFLAGCSPPSDLIVEFSQEPAKDLLLLFLMPDLEDIGQAIFEPKSGRRRKPARHGRKKRRGQGLPDPSDMIGQRVRAVVNPHDALQIGPFKYAFRIWNVYEGISFTAAVIDGITNIGYETLWGVLKVDATHCKDFDRLALSDGDRQTMGGASGGLDPIRVKYLEFNKGFNRTENAAYCRDRNFRMNFKCSFTGWTDPSGSEGYLALRNIATGEWSFSSGFNLKAGQKATREVNIGAKKGEWVAWGFYMMDGFVHANQRSILAFSTAEIPWL